jgi:hypothetical protein
MTEFQAEVLRSDAGGAKTLDDGQPSSSDARSYLAGSREKSV